MNVDFTIDLVNIGILLITSVAAVVAIVQLTKGVRTEKARLLRDLLNDLANDVDAMSMWYKIEYGNFEYANFHGSEDEKKLDRLLDRFDTTCQMYHANMIDKNQIGAFDYPIKRVYSDGDIQEYFNFLDEWYRDNGVRGRPWADLRKYAASLANVPDIRPRG